MNPELFFVVDVESFGLHGEGFAIGWIVVNKDGVVQDERRYSVDWKADDRSIPSGDWEWLIKNIPSFEITHDSIRGIRAAFWADWKLWKLQGAVMVADCPWPVESRFLNACVLDSMEKLEGPYPILDVASIAYAGGVDPLKTWDRLKSEKPVHDPLMDARQSARIFMWLVYGIGQLTWK